MAIPILHVLEATTGGTRRHLVDLVTHLDPDRFDVSVACATRRDPGMAADLERMRASGIDVHIVDMVRSIDPLHDASAARRLCGLMRARPYQIVHTHSSKAGMLGRYAAYREGVSCVVHSPHVFAFQMQGPAALTAFYAACERWAARVTNHIVCVSQAEMQAARARGICDPDRLVLVENGIDVGQYVDVARGTFRKELDLPDEARLIGVIGRLCPQKGQLDLMAAAHDIRERHPGAHFVFVGSGPDERRIKQVIARRGWEACFHCVPTHDDMPRVYADLDIVVQPSRWEGMPYAPLEAMASGRAVVATRTGGVPDMIVDGESGVLVSVDDPTRLAQSITALLADPARAEALGAAARARVREHYTLKRMVTQIEALYTGCLEPSSSA